MGSSPGTVYSSKKFGFEPRTLTYTSITVYGKRDPIFTGDLHRGAIDVIECDRRFSADCHRALQSYCEVAHSCFSYQNPHCSEGVPASKCEYTRDVCIDGE